MRRTGAEGENRTRDPLITNEVLYQLSYLGPSIHNNIRGKFLSMKRAKSRSMAAIIWQGRRHLENGNIAHPIPTPISKNRNSDQIMYFTRSFVRRRLKNPNATEIISANSVID